LASRRINYDKMLQASLTKKRVHAGCSLKMHIAKSDTENVIIKNNDWKSKIIFPCYYSPALKSRIILFPVSRLSTPIGPSSDAVPLMRRTK